jgi:hypothetical protein
MHEKLLTPKEPFDSERFEKAKNNFLERVNNAPDLPSIDHLDSVSKDIEEYRQSIWISDMISGALDILDDYKFNTSFAKVESKMAELIEKKSGGHGYEESYGIFFFAPHIFERRNLGGEQNDSEWEINWGLLYGKWGEKTITEEEKNKEPFYETEWWKSRNESDVDKRINQRRLGKFKKESPYKQEAVDFIFAVSEDLIKTL